MQDWMSQGKRVFGLEDGKWMCLLYGKWTFGTLSGGCGFATVLSLLVRWWVGRGHEVRPHGSKRYVSWDGKVDIRINWMLWVCYFVFSVKVRDSDRVTAHG